MAVPWLIFIATPFRSAVRPIANSMVTDLTEGEDRRKAFSLLYLGTNIGVAVGPMIAGFLFNRYLSWIFWGDALTTLFAILMVLLFVPDTKPDEEAVKLSLEQDQHGERAESGRAISALLRRPVLVVFVVLTLMGNLVYAQHQFSIPLHLNMLFQDDGARMYGMLMTTNAVIVLACTAPLTLLTKRLRPVVNMALACTLYAFGFGLLLFVRGIALLFVSTMIWTLGEILMVTNSNVFVASHTPMNHRGRFNGIIGLFFGAGFVFSPWLSGMYIDALGTESIWIWVAAFSLLTAGGFVLLRKPAVRTEEVPPERIRAGD
jgi:MFS family permease